MNEQALYFDHATATPCANEAKETLFEMMLSYWESPWAPYSRGQKGVYKTQESLASIRACLGVGEDRTFLLTHSGAEATSIVLHGIEKRAHQDKKAVHIIALLSERLAVMHALDSLRINTQATIDLLPVGPKGYVEKEAIQEKLTKETALVLLPFADPFSGAFQPFDDIASLLRHQEIPLALDITLALKKTPLSLRDVDADFVTFDACLLGSPVGIGGLIHKNEKNVAPFVKGDIGSSDMVVRLALLSTLLDSMDKDVFHSCTETARLRDLFERLLQETIPSLSFLYQDEERLPSISTALFPKVKNEALLYLLEKRKLSASMCGADRQSIAPHLFERGFMPEKAYGAIRFSFAQTTKEEEIVSGVKRIREAYERLSSVSPRGGVRP